MECALDVARIYTKHGQWVEPSSRQTWALDTVRAMNVHILMLSGGLGGAKTTTGANALAEAIGYNTRATLGKHLKYNITAPSFSQLTRVSLPMFQAVWNRATHWPRAFSTNPTVIDWSRKEYRIFLAGGPEICYASGANGATAIEGDEFTAWWHDEPALSKEETFGRLVERLRENVPGTVRFGLLTGTPRPGWSLMALHKTFSPLTDGIPDAQGFTRASLPTILNVDNLPAGYIDRIKRQYSPQMVEAFLFGNFVILTGSVYADWGEEAIVEHEHDPKKPVIAMWDPGINRAALIFCQETHAYKDGVPLIGESGWTVFDEIMGADISTEELTIQAANRPWMRDHSYITVAHDPAAGTRQSTTGTTDMKVMADTFERYGINVRFRSSRKKEDHAIEARCERLRAMVKSADGVRTLTITEQVARREYKSGKDNNPCLSLYRCMLEQPFIEGTDKPNERGDWKTWSHAPAAAGYGAVYLHPARMVDDEAWKEVAEAGAEPEPIGHAMGDFGADAMNGWASRGW